MKARVCVCVCVCVCTGTLHAEINGGATSLFNFRRSGKTSAINLKSKGEKRFSVRRKKNNLRFDVDKREWGEWLLIFIYVYGRIHSFRLETDFSASYQCAVQNAIMFS